MNQDSQQGQAGAREADARLRLLKVASAILQLESRIEDRLVGVRQLESLLRAKQELRRSILDELSALGSPAPGILQHADAGTFPRLGVRKDGGAE